MVGGSQLAECPPENSSELFSFFLVSLVVKLSRVAWSVLVVSFVFGFVEVFCFLFWRLVFGLG